jgi:hypothetical protein
MRQISAERQAIALHTPMILHRCNAARAWHHMMLTGALEYENLSVIGMVNNTLVRRQDSGQPLRSPALSCRAAGSAAFTSSFCRNDSS